MSIARYILGAAVVGVISLIYNYLIFNFFDFYPDVAGVVDFLGLANMNVYVLIFLKNFLVGLILMVMFSVAYSSIVHEEGESKNLAKGIFFFVLYAVFALISFSVGDILLMETQEGMLVLLTLDGFVETVIATIPVRLFYKV